MAEMGISEKSLRLYTSSYGRENPVFEAHCECRGTFKPIKMQEMRFVMPAKAR